MQQALWEVNQRGDFCISFDSIILFDIRSPPSCGWSLVGQPSAPDLRDISSLHKIILVGSLSNLHQSEFDKSLRQYFKVMKRTSSNAHRPKKRVKQLNSQPETALDLLPDGLISRAVTCLLEVKRDFSRDGRTITTQDLLQLLEQSTTNQTYFVSGDIIFVTLFYNNILETLDQENGPKLVRVKRGLDFSLPFRETMKTVTVGELDLQGEARVSTDYFRVLEKVQNWFMCSPEAMTWQPMTLFIDRLESLGTSFHPLEFINSSSTRRTLWSGGRPTGCGIFHAHEPTSNRLLRIRHSDGN